MKKSPRLEARRKKISKDIDIFVTKSFDMADRIHDLLKEKSIGQRDLANLLGKNESEISKWLNGTHNFTLRTLSTIENVLGNDVCVVAGKEKPKVETKFIYVTANPSRIATKRGSSQVNNKGQFDLQESTLFIKSDALA